MLRKIVLFFVAFVSVGMLIRPFIIKPIYIVEEQKPVIEKQKVVAPEKPLHNVELPDFALITNISQKKQAFFSFIRPSVEAQNDAIAQERQQVELLVEQYSETQTLSEEQSVLIKRLARKYRVKLSSYSTAKSLEELLIRIDVIPAPLVLVQAANESAWGTSRFARIGLNFFGIWCYQQGCGMVPRSRNQGANHEVEAFQSVDDAVKRYLHNINTNNAYQVFRTIRKQLREQQLPLSSEVLATGLLAYSERGGDYIAEITDMLRHNRRYIGSDSLFSESSSLIKPEQQETAITPDKLESL